MMKIDAVIILIIIAWIVLPTGDPTDVIFTGPMIQKWGMEKYLIVCAVLLFLVYKLVKGNGFSGKFSTIKKKVRDIF